MTKYYLGIIFFISMVFHARVNHNNIVLKVEVLNENTTRIPIKLVGHLIVVEGELFNKKTINIDT